ncbi:YeiH family protein [Natrarchaeobius chitinivorans]|uniref:Putative sulfate exporter family transporter n=1 Tax=Natrarchaeobius chitinivorans TaxID=1679083 RepID=A0A3N6LRL0_NATCH|nr:putative sulfate exporter family transporter [Natrarchaeobius chitinivorans]RQG91047.1 putative sulfate exporter family transporter [Natrarchaeobius chitinivorans]
MVTGVTRVLPGFVGLCLGAVLARGLSTVVGVNELLLAIGLGVLLANTIGVPDSLRPGTATHKIWLAAGIVLLGASLTIGSIVETGSTVLLLMIATVTVTVLTVEVIARNVAGLTERFGSLLAAGAGICGVSAVVAVGGGIRARETQIAYAAGVVLLIDAITIVVYPIVGARLGLSGIVFGVWAGVSMLSTGPVVAVGFAHSEVAGQWATMTKLARNALIGVVALGYASYYARRESGGSTSVSTLWTNFPKFVLGFLALVVLASVGVFSPDQQASIANAVDWLFLLAFVGLGTEIRATQLRGIGLGPALVVFAAMTVGSVLSLAVAVAVL